ncbi:MAG TPA: hypothetical protein PK639_04555 [Candidatus Woesebacteria bacterium]|nr:hypothetical protein [Candidatus Woesebacteria bacterium]
MKLPDIFANNSYQPDNGPKYDYSKFTPYDGFVDVGNGKLARGTNLDDKKQFIKSMFIDNGQLDAKFGDGGRHKVTRIYLRTDSDNVYQIQNKNGEVKIINGRNGHVHEVLPVHPKTKEDSYLRVGESFFYEGGNTATVVEFVYVSDDQPGAPVQANIARSTIVEDFDKLHLASKTLK